MEVSVGWRSVGVEVNGDGGQCGVEFSLVELDVS